MVKFCCYWAIVCTHRFPFQIYSGLSIQQEIRRDTKGSSGINGQKGTCLPPSGLWLILPWVWSPPGSGALLLN